eukprot:CAMPEP_0174924772 /NCGR_PEP_ID=MMETSP1355-20121228/7471_1 /TAXON_ID=464990 /ORGANISM="Hemiselmis tepida, Strain CCMP443" /LENGTH=36 /DNA_ID= /DNA_START= /DNA_END= /DNA_ORIENTATION=
MTPMRGLWGAPPPRSHTRPRARGPYIRWPLDCAPLA